MYRFRSATRAYAYRVICLSTLWLLAVWLLAFAAHVQAAPPTLTLLGREDSLLLAPHAQILEDASTSMSLDEALHESQPWRDADTDALSFELSHSAWWIRFSLTHAGPATETYIVDLGSPRQDHVRWVVLDPSGRPTLDRSTGDRLPRDTRLVDARSMALPLTLKPGEQVQVVVRVQSHDGMFESIAPKVTQRDTYFKALRQQDILLSVYFGALFALGLYNLFLYLSTRAVEFAAYVLYSFSLLAWNLSYLGYSFEFLLPAWPALNHQLILVTAGIAYSGIAWFVLTYLRLEQTLPNSRVPRLYRWSMVGNVVPVGLALTDHYLAAVVAGLLSGMPMLMGTLILSVKLSLAGRRDARFLAIAMGSLTIGAGAFYLELFGLAHSAFTSFGIQIGSFLEMLLLAFGLADSMNTLKSQKLQAEQQAHEAQRALASDLERQVRDRTHALEKANRALGELAITDELTGAFNRRHFNQRCQEALSGSAQREPLALCMFDIDHFKRYNDHYGHQAGDEVLRDVARAVATALKRSDDQLFRLGGEEFGVVFSARSAGAAELFANALRQAVRSLQRPHAGSPLGQLTASFGVAWHAGAQPLTLKELYAAADEALYRAKSMGRDQVVMTVLPASPARASSTVDDAALGRQALSAP